MRILAVLIAVVAALSGYEAAAQATLANPASQNCVAKGGKLAIEKNPKGGEYGVCVFADNLQCEEWAMLRGQCRTGGVKVTGYATRAARYCAITGGTYKITSASNTRDEKGACAFRGGEHVRRARLLRRIVRAAGCGGEARQGVVRVRGRQVDRRDVRRLRRECRQPRPVGWPQAHAAASDVRLGRRYANNSESVVFWNKGNTAFLEEKGQTTYEGCTTKG